jgi:ABC-type transporter Mla MlaB component
MLKVSIHHEATGTTLELAGRLADPWVEELRRCWSQLGVSREGQVSVDLKEVTFIDEKGKALLLELWRHGVALQAAGCLTRCIVEEITQTGRHRHPTEGSEGNASERK